MARKKAKKIKVQDLKPKKDAKGGTGPGHYNVGGNTGNTGNTGGNIAYTGGNITGGH